MNSKRKGTAIKEEITDKSYKQRTTIGVRLNTKEKLDNNRAPGQCYDGFICQLVDLWEKTYNNNKGLANTQRM